MFPIKDKIVLITGAAAGIGASVVRILLEEDVKHVTILDIDDKSGLAVQDELVAKHGSSKVRFIKCDITQEQELLDAFRTVKNEQGYIDVVINNAGIGNDKIFVKEIEVNLTALVRSTLQAWDYMRKDEGGRGGTVVNISSIAAFGSLLENPIYSATKSAVLMFSAILGNEVHYSRTGVRVLTICFGVTDTQIINKENVGSFDEVIQENICTSISTLDKQSPQMAAQGCIEAYKNGKSGSVWIVSSGRPAIDVTETYVQSTQVFNDIIYQ